jgi:hypothetical protein
MLSSASHYPVDVVSLISPQISQEDDGFEIRSLASSMDEEATPGSSDHRPTEGIQRSRSPAAPQPATASQPSRPSLDGETIFAVGEEDGDRWSDDESPRNSTERKGLMKGND